MLLPGMWVARHSRLGGVWHLLGENHHALPLPAGFIKVAILMLGHEYVLSVYHSNDRAPGSVHSVSECAKVDEVTDRR